MAAQQSLFHSLSDAHATYMLAFVGGFIDAAGYLKLQGVFTSSITGNLVVTCASVTSMNGVICRSTISLAFTLAGGFGAAMALRTRITNSLSQGSISIFLFCLEAITLIIVWIIGLHLVTTFPMDDPKIKTCFLLRSILVFHASLQHASTR
jgi:uncharacterized membrane protein YoaK (UPF0700 family)